MRTRNITCLHLFIMLLLLIVDMLLLTHGMRGHLLGDPLKSCMRDRAETAWPSSPQAWLLLLLLQLLGLQGAEYALGHLEPLLVDIGSWHHGEGGWATLPSCVARVLRRGLMWVPPRLRMGAVRGAGELKPRPRMARVVVSQLLRLLSLMVLLLLMLVLLLLVVRLRPLRASSPLRPCSWLEGLPRLSSLVRAGQILHLGHAVRLQLESVDCGLLLLLLGLKLSELWLLGLPRHLKWLPWLGGPVGLH